MSSKEPERTAQELVESALLYVEIAFNNLILEDARCALPPMVQMRWDFHARMMVHFLFPNLSDVERSHIERMMLEASSHAPNAKERWKAAKDQVEQFEAKLTAKQLEILELEEFSP